MPTAQLLFHLTEKDGVSGMEAPAVQAARGMLQELGECSVTPLGSLICRIKAAPPQKPHLLLSAHIDTIGLIVTFVDEGGFLRVSNCGGIDSALLLASQVIVHSAQGPLHGVVCTIPPHLGRDDSKNPTVEEICIDVGLDAKQACEKIQPGDRVSFLSQGHEMIDGHICSKTIDDRGGCVAVILAAQALAGAQLDCSLTVALTTLEEVGGQGAKTAAFALLPSHAIAVDVSFGHTPDAPVFKCGVVGEGPMIGIAPVLDNEMALGLQSCAKKHAIPFQTEVMGGKTGTDADQIATAGAGVRCALLSIPLRYMHTPIEIVAIADVEATANLIAAYVADTFGGDDHAV